MIPRYIFEARRSGVLVMPHCRGREQGHQMAPAARDVLLVQWHVVDG